MRRVRSIFFAPISEEEIEQFANECKDCIVLFATILSFLSRSLGVTIFHSILYEVPQ